ncbi:DNA kinase/phosphatase Pnk1 [Tilletia horrida]|uniref:DNA kinase/phosphatase Pnk1 n=1 Tax=Tilletia horrida TaxID=155126 RepID=A0AAN6JXY8_9BASI|nr:DNA kinase/phosphatase Pnk1 [Tilletia horrida]
MSAQSSAESSSSSSSSARRKAESTPSDPAASQKRTKLESSASQPMKLAPIFNRVGAAAAANSASSSTTKLRWLPVFGQQSSCHIGIFGNPFPSLPLDPKTRLKAAIFDLDGTLVVPKSGKIHPQRNDEYDFKFLWSHSLKQVQDEHRIHGRMVVIVTNQGYFKPGGGRERDLSVWKAKQANIGAALEVPHVVLVATGEDRFRKPAVGMWDAFWSVLLNGLHTQDLPEPSATPKYNPSTRRRARAPEGLTLPEVKITEIETQYFDAQESFYVGDAAGRVGDHSDVDRKWAGNVGVRFYTPEQYFTEHKKEQPYKLSGWAPSKSTSESIQRNSLPLFSPTSTPLIPSTAEERNEDLILFVGPPGAGKTEFYKRHLKAWGYEWVNQDTLSNVDACVRAVKKNLQAGKGFAHIELVRQHKSEQEDEKPVHSEELGKQVRCFVFDVERPLALHNNAFRANSGLEYEETSEEKTRRYFMYYN